MWSINAMKKPTCDESHIGSLDCKMRLVISNRPKEVSCSSLYGEIVWSTKHISLPFWLRKKEIQARHIYYIPFMMKK